MRGVLEQLPINTDLQISARQRTGYTINGPRLYNNLFLLICFLSIEIPYFPVSAYCQESLTPILGVGQSNPSALETAPLVEQYDLTKIPIDRVDSPFVTGPELIPVEWQADKTYFVDFSPRVEYQYFGPSGLGYQNSLQSLQGFIPLYTINENRLLFADLRLLLLGNSRFGFNFGGGYRQYFSLFNATIGGYGYFDNLDSGSQTVSQISGGLDILSSTWEARLNNYFPLDTDPQIIRTPLADTVFRGNQLFSNRILVYETALTGLDLEAGGEVYSNQASLWFFLGGYHFQGERTPQAWGIRARLEARLNEIANVQLIASNDRLFGTNFVVGLSARFPGYRPNAKRSLDHPQDRLAYPVQRIMNVLFYENLNHDETIPLNLQTGQPFHVVHVASGDSSNGNGTFEQPFTTLTQAINNAGTNSIIYVQPNETGYGEVIVLLEGQFLLGAGSNHQLTTVQGTTHIPRLSDRMPTIQLATNNPLITLADRSTVAGLAFENPDGPAFSGHQKSSVAVVNNLIRSTALGVSLNSLHGNSQVIGNEFINIYRSAVYIQQVTPGSSLIVGNNQISQANTSGTYPGAVSISQSSGSDSNQNTAATIVIEGNEVQNSSGNGIDFQVNGPIRTELGIAANVIDSPTVDGISVRSQGPAHTVVQLTGNDIRNGKNGISLAVNADRNGNNGQLDVVAQLNAARNQQQAGIKAVAQNGSTMTLAMRENTFTDNGGDGFRLQLNDSSIADVIIENDDLSRNTTGVNVVADGLSENNLRLRLDNVQVNSNRGRGIDITLSNQSRSAITLTQSSIQGNGMEGVFLNTQGQALLNLAVNNNLFENNQDGFVWQNSSQSAFQRMESTFVNNQFRSQRNDGLRIEASGNSQLRTLLSNNYFGTNTQNGLELSGNENASFWVDVERNFFEQNQATAFVVTASGTGVNHEVRLLAENNTLVGPAVPGFYTQSLADGKLILGLTQNDSDRGFTVENNGTANAIVQFGQVNNEGRITTNGNIVPIALDAVLSTSP